MTIDSQVIASSFRDPSGFVFERDGVLLRQVNASYRDEWELLNSSGLYERLSDERDLVRHEELGQTEALTDSALCVIRPERIPFISYPYEWSFGQLKAAAMLTLKIQRAALEYSMSLKDASAFNVQFVGATPIFIDTLSFERYRVGQPWPAYRQFCEHFLAPLALMAHTNYNLGSLQRLWIDGIPLSIATAMLPLRTRLKLPLLAHLHLHARSQVAHENGPLPMKRSRGGFSRLAMTGLIDSLERAVSSLCWNASGTEWANYYEDTNYSEGAMLDKRELVAGFVAEAKPETVWDLGANTGEFSCVARDAGASVVAMDLDRGAVERLFQRCSNGREERILPLVMDLTNPSPALGWNHSERKSLKERGPADMVLALALIHHLAIGNNVPLPMTAGFLSGICRNLVIEFVPKTDSQVARMLASREDVFGGYHREGFETAFGRHFSIEAAVPVRGSERVLYLMKLRGQ